MKKILTVYVFAVIATLIACGGDADNSNNGTADNTSTKSKPKKEIDGSKVYKTYCITCHGLYGDMGASGAHDLTESKLSLEERVEVISNGRNTMTPFKDLLNEEKIKAVAAYTMKLEKQ